MKTLGRIARAPLTAVYLGYAAGLVMQDSSHRDGPASAIAFLIGVVLMVGAGSIAAGLRANA
jgi:membrane protein DedA with SNARE-associated domain